MKTKIFLIAVIIFSSNYKCQELGIDFNIGYSKLLMEDVNNYLDHSKLIDFDSLLWRPIKNQPIKGWVYSEIGVSARFPKIVLKLSCNYITSYGEWESNEFAKYTHHTINVSTYEILLSIGYRIPIYKTAYIITEGGLGYGFAASESDFEVRSNLEFYNVLQHENYSLTGGYSTGRLRGGLEANLKFVLLRFVVGYRFANPVVLTGESNINGVMNDDVPIIKDDGSKLEFDFSGFNYQWGITILL